VVRRLDTRSHLLMQQPLAGNSCNDAMRRPMDLTRDTAGRRPAQHCLFHLSALCGGGAEPGGELSRRHPAAAVRRHPRHQLERSDGDRGAVARCLALTHPQPARPGAAHPQQRSGRSLRCGCQPSTPGLHRGADQRLRGDSGLRGASGESPLPAVCADLRRPRRWLRPAGLLGSGLTNLPSGPCVVIVRFAGFLLALLVRVRSLSP
jgi:hypothetical protein